VRPAGVCARAAVIAEAVATSRRKVRRDGMTLQL
jgi:hypothetical protein